MEECELCGRTMETANVVEVEGAELRICFKCASGKKVISREYTNRKPQKEAEVHKPYNRREFEQAELILDYGMKIKNAREKMKIPGRVLAEILNEKENFIARIEKEKTTPPDALVIKLEKVLNIKLREE